MEGDKKFDPLSRKIIGLAIEVHRTLGPGLLESAYEQCLSHELTKNSLGVRRQVAIPVNYKGLHLDCSYRLDILVENSLIVELKAVERLLPIHTAQVLTYLRLTGLKIGLLLNFHTMALRDGIRRIVL
ncbi:MAG TPA: GxxExxY protein [Rhodospirillaceae bacterium]|nr:GxxExxY protein [Rhodospirillaceae bacterium]